MQPSIRSNVRLHRLGFDYGKVIDQTLEKSCKLHPPRVHLRFKHVSDKAGIASGGAVKTYK